MQGAFTILIAAGFVLVQPHAAPAQDAAKTVSQNPTGEGDPNTITCRPPQPLPNSRLRGPEVCKTNQVWAQYTKDGMTVAPDGIHDMPSEKYRSTHPLACRPATAGGSSVSTANQTNFGMICE